MRPRKAREIFGKCPAPWGLPAALAAALLLPGCPKSDPPSCEGPTMAFRLLLIAQDAPLPDNTALTVEHGTATEVFRIDRPFPSSDVVFCCPSTREGECVEPTDASAHDGGSGPPSVEGLFCELWTDGAADVIVEANGYPRLARTLEARSNDGCLQTVDVTLELERRDAAP